jgi:hypothetical protein
MIKDVLKDVVARWQYASDDCEDCGYEHDLDDECQHSDYCDCDWCVTCECCDFYMADCSCDHARGDYCSDEEDE